MADLQKLLVTVAADVSSFVRGMNQAKGGISDFERAANSSVAGVRSVFGSLAGIGSVVGLGLGAGESLSVLRDFGKLEASLRVVEGSAEDARRAMDGITKFAVETPFTVDEITKAYVRLKLYGFDATEASLKALGNTASIVGVSMTDAVDAIAAAARGEFDPIEKFGVQIKKDGEELRVTVDGVTRTIENNARSIEAILVELGNTKFAGAMSEQMKELDGDISNTKDAFEGLVRTIGNLGVTNALKRAFSGATEFLAGFSRQINAVFGTGIQAQIDALEIRSKELGNKYGNAVGVRDSLGVVGRALISDEDLAQFDRDAQQVNRALADLRKTRDSLNKAPVLPPIPETATASVNTAASGMKKVAEHAKAAKQSTVELTDAFSEFAKRNGEILPGGSFAEIIQTQQADIKKINADDITSVFEEAAAKRLDEEVINPRAVEETRKLSDATRELGLTFTSAFEGAVIGGRELSEVLKGLAQDIAGLALRKLFTEPAVDAASKAIGGFDWTGILGSVFGGFMAAGGNVSAGKAYVVGERRPELFVPSTSGSIIPSLAGLGGGLNVQIIDQRGSGAPAIEQTRQRDPTTGAETLRILVREEMKAAMSSGHLDKSMSMNYGLKRQGIQR